MTQLKHVGMVRNTGRRCVVVFRELYDDHGHVSDENTCRVFETDSLPDQENLDLVRIVESEPAQATGDLFNVLARERLANGMTALSWLAQNGRLREYPTDSIDLRPDANTSLPLNRLNKIVRMQQAGATQKDIEIAMANDPSMASRDTETAMQVINETVDLDTVLPESETSSAGPLTDVEIAKSRIAQAEEFERQATQMREEAYVLDPTLKPKKRGRPAKKKAAATA